MANLGQNGQQADRGIVIYGHYAAGTDFQIIHVLAEVLRHIGRIFIGHNERLAGRAGSGHRSPEPAAIRLAELRSVDSVESCREPSFTSATDTRVCRLLGSLLA
jgi:hypothetical protein